MKVKITLDINVEQDATNQEIEAKLDSVLSDPKMDKVIKDKLFEKIKLLRTSLFANPKKMKVFQQECKERQSRKHRSSNREKELSQVAEEFRSDLIKNQTQSEKVFKALLKSLKIDYEFQKILYTPTKFFIVDFYIPNKRVVFEIDGEYHDNKYQKKRDTDRTSILKINYIKEIYRFTNDDVLKNISFVTDRIRNI